MTEFIYLHGFASGPNSNKASAFKKRFDELKIPCHIPDLQEDDFENLTLSRQIRLVQAILDKDKDKNFGLIGSSMGGYLASLAAQTRDSVKAMYLMAPGFNFLSRWKKKLDFSETTGPLIPVFHYRYNKEVLLNINLFRDAEIWESVSLERKIPTQIVHGLHDDTVDIQESRNFVRSHPSCKLTELDSDHGLLSSIDWIIEDCLGFFKKQKLL
ncbi:MAG: alpha/beta fold hydrolase [Nitrospinae bacterium]|nr:alpha/beta fold hydrolase [Nitrospinota bacterium]